MRDRDLDRRLDAAYARLVDQTDRIVATPDVEAIHRRVDLRSARGIGATFAATTVAGLLLGAVVLGVGGVGMGPDTDRSAGHRAATPTGRASGSATTAPPPLTAPRGAVTGSGAPKPSTSPTPTAVRVPVPTVEVVPAPDPAPARRSSASPSRLTTPPASLPPSARPTAPVAPRTPPPSPSSAMGATTVPRSPLRLEVSYKSGQLDERGCRRTRRVARTVAAPGPETVARVVLAGPSAAERDGGVHTLYGRSGTPTPARVSADWSQRVLTVDYLAPGTISFSPASCRGPEIRWPVLDAMRQSHPGWTVRFLLQGSAQRFTDHVNGG